MPLGLSYTIMFLKSRIMTKYDNNNTIIILNCNRLCIHIILKSKDDNKRGKQFASYCAILMFD